MEIVFTTSKLNKKADVLLNLNLMCFSNIKTDFSGRIAGFNGIKIFHIGDYFWYRPGSESYKLLQSIGVDHLLGYAMHDRYCSYFRQFFPEYQGRVWGIPFGFTPRFAVTTPFSERKKKAVALGSVNPLRPLHLPVSNYRETADFFPDDNWFHEFRRELILNKNHLTKEMDSMLPEFPSIKDFKYDLVAKFNEYQMFVTCESIFSFPSAKVFEGMACQTVLVCADLDCNKEYGLKDGENCIMFEAYNIIDFQEKVKYYQSNQIELEVIARAGRKFVVENYSLIKNVEHIINTTDHIVSHGGNIEATPLIERI
ncbi:glycosyltransferase [Schleiferiaceae bacterium]|nr:glycosyltransferase [Schleiferiaceae bacterium]